MRPPDILRALKNIQIDMELADDHRAPVLRAALARLLELETTYAKLAASDMAQFWDTLSKKGI